MGGWTTKGRCWLAVSPLPAPLKIGGRTAIGGGRGAVRPREIEESGGRSGRPAIGARGAAKYEKNIA